jgi:hypothetical protein
MGRRLQQPPRVAAWTKVIFEASYAGLRLGKHLPCGFIAKETHDDGAVGEIRIEITGGQVCALLRAQAIAWLAARPRVLFPSRLIDERIAVITAGSREKQPDDFVSLRQRLLLQQDVNSVRQLRRSDAIEVASGLDQPFHSLTLSK